MHLLAIFRHIESPAIIESLFVRVVTGCQHYIAIISSKCIPYVKATITTHEHLIAFDLEICHFDVFVRWHYRFYIADLT